MVKQLNILLRTFSSNEHYNGDCDYALLKLSPLSIRQMRDRMDLAKRKYTTDPSFVCIEFWDSAPQYFSSFDDLENLVDVDTLLEGTPLCVKNSIIKKIPDSSYQRTEADRIVVFSDHVYWECRPKHCDITIETAELDRKYIETQLEMLW